jgi:hypothetical protein
VKLENVFRRIHANSANLFHGRPPLSEIYSDLILARLIRRVPSTPTELVPLATRQDDDPPFVEEMCRQPLHGLAWQDWTAETP